MKLLLVEDHPLVAQAMGLYLAEAGHEIVGIATHAQEAVELAGIMHPDLGLVDVQLAYGTSGHDAAVGYLRKPYSGRELIAAIQAAEDYLKIQKPDQWSPGLEFYEGSLVRRCG
jgi:DNA-binding response OmpR family regulator